MGRGFWDCNGVVCMCLCDGFVLVCFFYWVGLKLGVD